MKNAIIAGVSAVVLIGAILLISFLAYPRHKDPVVYDGFTDQNKATAAALLEAAKIGGKAYTVLPTGSMEPVLHGGDVIVVDSNHPFSEVEVGVIVVYLADWQRKGPPVSHRVYVHEKDGLIVGGDAVPAGHSEARWRVTAETYRGTVVAVYRMGKGTK